jgi:DtxR family transcriptional regulator, Mn-dependent transcriptional regulator
MQVKAASVTGMLTKLAELNLVEYEKRQGATLSPAGEKIALEVIRHHRLIETYLKEAMGYTWDQVHAEADKLEHAISEDFEDRIAEMLGHPETDPHGDPIPSKDGRVAAFSRQTLLDAKTDVPLRVERVRDENASLLRRLAALGLTPGARITLCRADEQLSVRGVDGAHVLIDADIAGAVFVTTDAARL